MSAIRIEVALTMNAFVRKWRSAVQIFRYEGPTGLLGRIVSKALTPVIEWNIMHFFSSDLAEEIPHVSVRGDFQIRVSALANNVNEIVEQIISAGASERNAVQERFERGDVIIGVYSAGQLVGYTWLTLSDVWVLELKLTLTVRAGEGVTYDAFVRPEFRGRGIYTSVELAALNYARDAGLKRIITYVEAPNVQSLKTQWRLNKEKMMTVISVRALGMSRPWWHVFGREASRLIDGRE